MAQATKANVAELNNDVTKQMKVLREDVAKLTEVVAEYGKARGRDLTSEAANKAADVAQAGKETAKAVQAKAQNGYADAEDAVRQNPAAAVGIAAGLGFLVGLIASRR